MKWFRQAATVHNYGTITWTDGPVRGECYNGAVALINHNSAIWTINGAFALNRSYWNYPASVVNDGLVVLGSPGALVSSDWAFTQNTGGTLQLALAGTNPTFARLTTLGLICRHLRGAWASGRPHKLRRPALAR